MSEMLKDLELKIKEVAERIKAVRESVGCTPEEMAVKSDISLEDYLAYEEGNTDFSFTFIYKFANACGVEITDLMEGVSPSLSSYNVTRKGEGVPIARRAGFNYERLAPQFRNKIAEPFLVTIPYVDEASREPHMSRHKGQEFDIVISGTLMVQIGDNVEELHEGDVIYYNSGEEH
ncbi:MAG: XRE family transcriptional regulator [Ruminococcus sp.]|nr:XRE family transcriptional regulator [Ruminococcus sp.]